MYGERTGDVRLSLKVRCCDWKVAASRQGSWTDVRDYAEPAVYCCFLVKLLYSGKMGTRTRTHTHAHTTY